MFSFIGRRLWMRFMVFMTITVIVVFSAIIWFNMAFQNRLSTKQMENQDNMVAYAIKGGMIGALSVGNNNVVIDQFKRLHSHFSKLKAFVYDWHGKITFSTEDKSVGTDIGSVFDGGKGGSADKIRAMLVSSSKAVSNIFQAKFNGERFSVVNSV